MFMDTVRGGRKTRAWERRLSSILPTLVEIQIRPWKGRRACFGLCPCMLEKLLSAGPTQSKEKAFPTVPKKNLPAPNKTQPLVFQCQHPMVQGRPVTRSSKTKTQSPHHNSFRGRQAVSNPTVFLAKNTKTLHSQT